jgi:hypothetical protein
MKLQHAAALVLVGCYLITPPVRDDQVRNDVSFRRWMVSESFDSAAACEKKRLALATDPVGQVVRLNLPSNFDYKGKKNQGLLTAAIQSAMTHGSRNDGW